jgi:hypothetical protein
VNAKDSAENAKALVELLKSNNETIKVFREQFQLAIAALQTAAARIQHERAQRKISRHREAPKQPAPVAGLLHGFARQLDAKVKAIDQLLTPDQRERLRVIAPGFVRGVLANDPDVMRLVQVVLGGSAGAAAVCIGCYLPTIEQRFAS